MQRSRASATGVILRLQALALRVASRVVPPVALVILIVLAGVARLATLVRRLRRGRPRLIWGPTPLISIKYWSEAMTARGFESVTAVDTYYASYKRSDFDFHRADLLGGATNSWSLLVRDYLMFAWVLRRGDVLLRFFDGGYLRETPLRWFEGPLLRIAGKKVIVSPYGGDVAVAGHLEDLQELLFEDYPQFAEQAEFMERRVLHMTRWADVRIRNHQLGFVPEYDVIWPNQFAIDLSLWAPAERYSDTDGRTGEVTIVHAPNHRRIKGTEHFERAVEALRGEGLAVRLEILEGRPNDEVRAALLGCDIVADQLLLPGYALFSIEAMAAGKPVLVNVGRLPEELRDTDAIRDCPAVDSNPGNVLENLRALCTDPRLRETVGRAGRGFTERYHSYEAIGADWEAIIAHVWSGDPLPEHLRPTAEPKGRTRLSGDGGDRAVASPTTRSR
jgi:hypothetical protein